MKYSRDKLLSPDEFYENFGVKVSTLADWRSQGRGCRYFKAGNKVWYHKDDADVWAESRIVETNNGINELPDLPVESRKVEKNNGTEEQGRDLPLEVQARRPRVQRNNRLGRHRVKHDVGPRN